MRLGVVRRQARMENAASEIRDSGAAALLELGRYGSLSIVRPDRKVKEVDVLCSRQCPGSDQSRQLAVDYPSRCICYIIPRNMETTQTYRDLAVLEAGRPQEAEANLVKGLRRTGRSLATAARA
jgi:hypothetical protein